MLTEGSLENIYDKMRTTTPEEQTEIEKNNLLKKTSEVGRYFETHADDIEKCLEAAGAQEDDPVRSQLAFISEKIGELNPIVEGFKKNIPTTNNLNDRLGNFLGTLSLISQSARKGECHEEKFGVIVSNVDAFSSYLGKLISNPVYRENEFGFRDGEKDALETIH